MIESNKKVYATMGILFCLILIIYMSTMTAMSAAHKQNKVLKESMDTLRESISILHKTDIIKGAVDTELFNWCKKLENQNLEQQKVTNKLNEAMFGEMEIGENPD